MADKPATVTLVAQCLCQAHRFTAEVSQSALPLKGVFCHCDTCRHTTGALYSSDVPWPGDNNAIRESTLRRYALFDSLAILFCDTCSSPMFFERKDPEQRTLAYGALSGILTNADVESLVQITDHICVGDTIDGGASPWLRNLNTETNQPSSWVGRRGESQKLCSDWPGVNDLPNDATDIPVDEIPIRWACNGVNLVFHKPTSEYASKPRSELPWFIDPVTNKSSGGFDVCDSCRLSSGADIFHWTFASFQHLSFSEKDAKPVFPKSSIELNAAVSAKDRDPLWGTLTSYESSADVRRYFCSKCSACVFYAADERSEMVDIAIGLLESPDGARAEALVSWNFGGTCVWRQDVAGGWRDALVEKVERAADSWRERRAYPKNWRRILKEQAAKE
ncbi:Mss4-like protein [Xylariaceae sp. FL1272]|nr:Mss4-like protein [Xylariaceae sp. FL1272]